MDTKTFVATYDWSKRAVIFSLSSPRLVRAYTDPSCDMEMLPSRSTLNLLFTSICPKVFI